MDQDSADVRARALWFDRKAEAALFRLWDDSCGTDQINCTVKP